MNGAYIGASATDTLGFWGTTPIVQPASADQAEPAAQSQDTITDSSGGTANTTIAAITDASAAGSADVGPVADGFADVAAQLAKIKDDVAALRTFCVAIRTALVNAGLIKGAA